jgi:hypothetical protein
MKASFAVILISLITIGFTNSAHARVIKPEPSWFEKIFTNDKPDMIQKSPFGQPQEKKKNPRARQPQKEVFTDSEELRTRAIKKQQNNPRHRAQQSNNDRGKQHIQNQRQQRMAAQKQRRTANVND